ncbi:hypothetical protein RRG08_014756 [Elysia crispata]|uniref:Uncharacterized protein n=1 Tax=Elysia crispata TaxID=231223 RepID=A0AAE1ASX6_9GAST|nr:hypothetical protein RRG08_014756 [Elysia crispata]
MEPSDSRPPLCILGKIVSAPGKAVCIPGKAVCIVVDSKAHTFSKKTNMMFRTILQDCHHFAIRQLFLKRSAQKNTARCCLLFFL